MILGFYKKGNKAQVYHKASCVMYELPKKENQEIQLIDISRKKERPNRSANRRRSLCKSW